MSVSPVRTPVTRMRRSVKKQLREETREEKQVTIHCHYTCTNPYGMYIRIWPTTYLIAHDIQHRSDLLHVENIPVFPIWLAVPPGVRRQFTLIFSGLPKSCNRFDLKEEIPQSGGFFVGDIVRSETDVYHVEIF